MLARARKLPSLTDFPEDQSICTMYVGGLPETITQQDLLDHFYSFGEVKAVRKSEAKRCAFVTFATRAMAEETARSHAQSGLQIKGNKLKLMWGKPSAKHSQGGKPAGHSGDKRPHPAEERHQQRPQTTAAMPYPSMDPSQMGSAPQAKRAKQN